MLKELGCQIVTQLIIDRYKHLQEDKLVFGKMNYWSMCKKLKTVMTACGIEKAISYHCGRHSFATLALSKGMPIESVSRVLGHTNIVTTQIYARITSQKLDNDLTMLGNKLNASFKDIKGRSSESHQTCLGGRVVTELAEGKMA